MCACEHQVKLKSPETYIQDWEKCDDLDNQILLIRSYHKIFSKRVVTEVAQTRVEVGNGTME